MALLRRAALAFAPVLLATAPHITFAQDEQTGEELPHIAQQRAIFLDHQAAEQRLQDLGWMLATGNAQFCHDMRLGIGLRVQDARAFGNPAMVRRILERSYDFTARTIATGSPAAEAGIEPNQAILAIDGEILTGWPVDLERGWARYERAHGVIEQSLKENGEVTLLLEGNVAQTIAGVPACATRFEMQLASDTALADGERVRFGRDFPAFGYSNDEFAAIIAHELAHNLLGHPRWLSNTRRTAKQVRKTEREADRLMPWLLANAGLEPEAALRFMERWGPQTETGLFRARSHEHWKTRVKTIADELPQVRQAMEEEGFADWKARFRREIEP